MADVPTPTFTDTVNQEFLAEPLGGPIHPYGYLDRFPEALYDKSPDAHWVRFLYTLLGPAGIGWLKKQYLDARLALAEHGFEGFDIERYYGDPFGFGRILSEQINQDLQGLLPQEEWNEVKAKDEAYRSRALEFFGAARLGTTPEGMRLAAQSGLAHDVEIIENYKALFDFHSDEPKGLEFWGQTTSLNEFIVTPRKEVSQSEVQRLDFEDTTVAGGTFVLVFRGQGTTALAWNSSYIDVGLALQSLSAIGAGNVEVTGGPSPNPFFIYFTDMLADQEVPEIEVISALVDSNGAPKALTVSTEGAGRQSTDEVLHFSDQQQHNMQTALDYLRPVNSLPTFAMAPGLFLHRPFSSVHSSSNHFAVLRYVTGSPRVHWPPLNSTHWIERGVEKQAPRARGTQPYHYAGFHGLRVIRGYTGAALDDPDYQITTAILKDYNSQHIGPFNAAMREAIPFLRHFTRDDRLFSADKARADYPEQPVVTAKAGGQGLINGIYPMDYAHLQGVAQVKYQGEQFWASRSRDAGSEVLEVDLGQAQAVNFVSFDSIKEPIDLDIAFDLLDQAPRRKFLDVTPDPHQPFFRTQHYTLPNLSPWETLEYHFTDAHGRMIYTRFIRITLSRRDEDRPHRYLWDDDKKIQRSWSVFVRNLRIGRLFS